ncbi:CZB domain-containing protein [Ferribacterium limneticum]|uniref:CZB domain-containing protein n=1 Tax=Ferribacterium limneticum TaxID=76259 RepID=UPI001CFA20F1|nr:CZB domain-containing protein [Ferribacterium limneticum]UCV30064.1 CZB domain-containing protein [Ferribacterium limneticum]UCV33983.1 CZB domain-containing protein [Ferribacterium limneticum]
MKRIDIDSAIRLHTQWRRQFLNAFAGGAYADMPLSEHRGCTLAKLLKEAEGTYVESPDYQELLAIHDRFHALANDIVDLSNNGLGDSADLLLPELNEASHQLVGHLDKLREQR